MKLIDLTNEVFGKLTVLYRAENRIEPSGRSKTYWKCKCECGVEKEVEASSLRSGTSKSCGCVNKERMGRLNLSHGSSNSFEYKTLVKIKERCYNSNSERYNSYGGRGIKVCDRWLESFENFLEDMGERPEGYSIERINVDGNYEPENCKWIPLIEQHYNKQNTKFVEYNGNKVSLSKICKELRLPYKTTWKKLNKGITFETIIKNYKNGQQIQSDS